MMIELIIKSALLVASIVLFVWAMFGLLYTIHLIIKDLKRGDGDYT